MRPLKRYKIDYIIIISISLLIVIGLMALYSASISQIDRYGFSFAIKQMQWLFIGSLIAFAVIVIGYERLIDFGYILHIICILLLITVAVLGITRYGAQRWIGIFGFNIQPSEFVKLTTILSLAHYLGSHRYNLDRFSHLIAPMIIVGIPFVLVLLQPDLGTALSFVPIFIVMIYVSGVRVKFIGLFVLSGLIFTPFAWHFLKAYQKQRLLVFIDPNVDPLGAGYTIIQSKIAIGSGGITGKGWLSGTQNQLNFLPERHTDFIFSVIGEESGLIGTAMVITIFLIFFLRSLNIAQKTGDIYGRLVIVGLVAMIAFQVFVNICMTIGIMPVVGLPLPFISYGGSSLIISLIGVAMILGIALKIK